MKEKGFYGIGCLNMKNSINYGTLFRTAQIFDADFIFLIGHKFRMQSSDTMKSWKHVPLFIFKDFDDFNSHRPFNCPLVGIELLPEATPIKDFTHPRQACYLLGAEDNGLTKQSLEKCQHIVSLPGKRSLNVSVAGSLVLYDRLIKMI